MPDEFVDNIEKKREGKNEGNGQKCRICGFTSMSIGNETEAETSVVPYPANTGKHLLGLYAHWICLRNLPNSIQAIGSPTRCRICGMNEATNGNITEVTTTNLQLATKYGAIEGLFHRGCVELKPDFVEYLGKKNRIALLKKQIATLHKSYDHYEHQADPYSAFKKSRADINTFEAELKKLEGE